MFLTCFLLLAKSNKENETDQHSQKPAKKLNLKNHINDDSLDPAFDESSDDDADPSYQQGDGDDVDSEPLSAEDDVDEFERTAVSEVSR